jgi:hypothetical protein
MSEPKLEIMRVLVNSELGTLSPESLRRHDYTRDYAAEKAAEILNAMKGLYGADA